MIKVKYYVNPYPKFLEEVSKKVLDDVRFYIKRGLNKNIFNISTKTQKSLA